MKPFVLGLVGPTGTGKTELALRIAKKVPAEIISADSMQVYKGLDIGTAKPTRSERRKVMHHAMDCVSPSRNYSIYQYRSEALRALRKIEQRHKAALVVGGSGLYIRALFDGLTQHPKTDPALRKRLEKELDKCGVEGLFRRLEESDPIEARRIDRKNPRRVLRALERVLTKSQSPDFQEKELPSLAALGYSYEIFGITLQREALYERVEKRIDRMFKAGWLDEVKRIKRHRLGRTVRQAIGYKELLNSSIIRTNRLPSGRACQELQEISARIKQSTRHLVKKQFTWFRRDPRIHWIDVTEPSDLRKAEKQLIELLKRRADAN